MFEFFDKGAQELGAPPELLLAGTSVSLNQMRNPRGRAAWDDFARICENFEAMVGGPYQGVEWGKRVLEHDYSSRLATLARMFVSPFQLYDGGLRWLGPTLFRCVNFEVEQTGADNFQVTLSIPASNRSGAAWFRIVEGSLTVLPRLLGMSDAAVMAQIGSHRVVYDLITPPRTGVLPRVRTSMRALLRPNEALDVIAETHTDIYEAYVDSLRTEREMQALIASLPDPVALIADGTIIHCNTAWSTTFGDPRDRATEAGPLLHLVAEDDRAAAAPIFGEDDLERTNSPPAAFRMIGAAGTLLAVEPSRPVTVHYRGKRARVVALRDVTEVRRREITAARVERMAAIGTLAAGIAHEVNNPLTWLLGHLSMLQGELEAIAADTGEDWQHSATEHLSAAQEGARRVAKIVGELQGFARSTPGHRGPVSVEAILESCLRLAGNELRHKATLVRKFSGVPPVVGDESRLGQAFLNLLVNAVQAIEPGDVAGNSIIVSTRTLGPGEVVVEIEDTGVGIGSDAIGHVFEPFQTSKSNKGGTGLGLSICHGIVDEHGGRIELDSEPGKGSSFRIVLPRAPDDVQVPAEAEPADEVVPQPASTGQQCRILVIDDEPALLEVVTAALSDHEVHTACGGQAALDILAQDDRFCAIVCDLMMPDVTGLHVYRQVLDRDPELARRFVFITGGTFTDQATRFLEEVDNVRLFKPFAMSALADAVTATRAAWERSRADDS